jgi:hypothetical protein
VGSDLRVYPFFQVGELAFYFLAYSVHHLSNGNPPYRWYAFRWFGSQNFAWASCGRAGTKIARQYLHRRGFRARKAAGFFFSREDTKITLSGVHACGLRHQRLN